MNLFHPELPGVVAEKLAHQIRTARDAGWRRWDELTGEQQDAHEAAVAAAAAEEEEPVTEPEPPVTGDTSKE